MAVAIEDEKKFFFLNQCFIVCINFFLLVMAMQWHWRAKKSRQQSHQLCVLKSSFVITKSIFFLFLVHSICLLAKAIIAIFFYQYHHTDDTLKIACHDMLEKCMCGSWFVKMNMNDICSLHDLFTFYFYFLHLLDLSHFILLLVHVIFTM